MPSGVLSEPRSEKEGLNLTKHRQEFRGNQTISDLSVREGRVEFFIKKRLNYLFIEAMFLLHTNFKTSKKSKDQHDFHDSEIIIINMHVYIHTPLDFVPCAFLLIERYIWREMHFILSPDFFFTMYFRHFLCHLL